MNGPETQKALLAALPADARAAVEEEREEEIARIADEAITGPPPTSTNYEQARRVHSRHTESAGVLDGSSTDYGTGEASSNYEHLRGGALAAWDGREDFPRWVLSKAGLRWAPEERQTWTALGREIQVAVWEGDERGFVVVRVLAGWPIPPAPPSLSLTEVYIITVAGEWPPRRGAGERSPERALWKRRALSEAGLVELPPFQPHTLPDGALPSAALTWEVIVSVRRCHLSDPLPLVVPFLMRWSAGRLTESQAISGKRILERQAFIEHVGDAAGRFGKPTKLWRVAGARRAA